jgi:hypothetical protein
MNDVLVSRYRHIVMSRDSVFSVKHPLARRMSPLQKSALEGLECWRLERAEEFDHVFRELRTPLFFASSFGEIEATIKEADCINQRSLPVSPAAFQHSVQNCAPGYFSIINCLDSPNLTFSSGYLTLDKTLYWAWQKVRHGAHSAVCVVAANEQGDKSGSIVSYGEIMLVHNGNCVELEKGDFDLASFNFDWCNPVIEPEGSNFPLLRLDEKHGDFSRILTSESGETLLSHWRARS